MEAVEKDFQRTETPNKTHWASQLKRNIEALEIDEHKPLQARCLACVSAHSTVTQGLNRAGNQSGFRSWQKAALHQRPFTETTFMALSI